MSKLIDLIGLTNIANDIRDWVNAHFQRKVNGKGLSTYDYDKTAKDKVDAIPADPQYTDTVYDDTVLAGRVSTIEGKESGWDAKQEALVSGTNIKTINNNSILGEGNLTISSGGGTSDYSDLTNKPQINSVTLSGNKSLSDLGIAAAADIPTVPTKLSDFTDDLGTSPTHSHSQYLTSHQDITGKADKVSSATNGNFAALDSNGNLTDSGHKHSDYLTSYTETDPVFTASAAHGISSTDITNWNGKQDALTFEGTYNASTNKAATMSAVIPSSTDIKNIVYITESDYNNLGTKVATTLYIIPESNV